MKRPRAALALAFVSAALFIASVGTPPSELVSPRIVPCPGISAASTELGASGSVHILSPCPGNEIAYVNQVGAHDDLVVMYPDGSGKSTIYTTSSKIYSPSWSPDGRAIVFLEWDRLARIDIGLVDGVFVGSNLFVFPSFSSIAWYPMWSPRGDEISFYTTDGSIATVPATGGLVQTLYVPPEGSKARWPTWNSNGTELAFVETGATESFIKTIDRGTGTVVRTWSLGQFTLVRFAEWSRPGKDLVTFTGATADSGDAVYTLDLATGQVVRIASGWRSTWSPDNRRLVIEDFSGGRTSIVSIDLETGAKATLARHGSWPDWGIAA